ncbi:hypothetical protein AB0M48_34170 [Lentzea sp. NPDC051208]|uniref:hypothetical protein n=1 Tax=Lentzea sp. NPDC051208 TaxID=3154642 RepID=UPI0034488BCD
MRVAALCAAVITVLAAAVPAQAQAGCVWRPTDLPLPETAPSGTLSAASPDGRYFAGQVEEGVLLLWHDRQLIELPGTESAWRVAGVNGSGHVVAIDDVGSFVHRDGAKQYLPVPEGRKAYVRDVNEAGDVLGYLDGGNTTIVWKAADPGTYELIQTANAVAIDEEGRIAFRNGVIRSADGTQVQIAGHPAVQIEKFQSGRVIGRVDRAFNKLREWTPEGAVVRDYVMNPSSPIGINRDGMLASGYFSSGNRYGAWQGSTFVGDVGSSQNLHVVGVTDTGLLAGYRQWRAEDNFWGPSTWACS